MHASHWLAVSSSIQPRLLIGPYVCSARTDLNVVRMSKLRSSSGAAIAGPHSFADHLTNRRAVSANIINHICRSVIPIVPLIDILKHFDSSAGEQLQSIIYGVLVFHGAKQQQPAAQQRRTMAALISPATPRLDPGALLPIL